MYISLATFFWTCLIVGFIIIQIIDRDKKITRQKERYDEEKYNEETKRRQKMRQCKFYGDYYNE